MEHGYNRILSEQVEDPSDNSMKSKVKQFKKLLRKDNRRKYVSVISLMVVGVIGISSLLLSQRLVTIDTPDKSQAAPAVPWTYPRKMKVIIMRYFNPASKPDYKNPALAQVLTDSMQGILYRASRYHGGINATSSVQVEVVGTYDFTGQPPNNADWEVAYRQMLEIILPNESKTVCDKVNTEGIDQVWFMGDPTIPGFVKGPEFAISSKYVIPGTLPLNYEYAILPRELFCGGQKSFSVLFFDLSRIEVSMHAFGHYLESLIGSVQGFDLFYKRFMGVSYAGNGVDGEVVDGARLPDLCGSVHVPPNVNTLVSTNPVWYKGYYYNSPNEEQSSCYNWKPDGTGQKTAVSSNTWINNPLYVSGSDELKYHMWWAQNFPNIGNSLTHNNLPIPNWWDFVVDTDGTIAWYLNSQYFMNPGLLGGLNVRQTESCVGSPGSTVTTCTGPTGSTTLGISDGEVLQANTGVYKNMALVTAAYRASGPVSTSAQITKVTYCDVPMTRVGGTAGRAKYKDQTTEMWYLIDPPSGTCKYTVTFSKNPEENILSATIFNNVDSVNPIESFVTKGAELGTGQVGSYTQSKTGPKNSMMECILSSYPNGSANFPVLNITNGRSRSLFYRVGPANHINAQLASSFQRTTEGENTTLTWNTNQQQNYAMTCANFRLSPPLVPPPPITSPVPTSTPSPITVDIKANGSNGPITISYNQSANLTWTSNNATSCTASDGWTGTKAVSGSQATGLLTVNKVFKLTCTGAAGGSVSDSVAVNVVRTPIVDLKINGSDTSVTLDRGIAPTLAWIQTGGTSCAASGGWSGAKAIAGGEEKGAVLGSNATYILTCANTSGSSSDSVSVIASANTAQNGYYAQYFSDTNFQKLVGTNVVTGIYNDWSTNGIAFPGVPTNYYSIRYTAQITPALTGTHTFVTTSDNRVRVYIDDKPVIENWDTHGRTVNTGTMALTAGKKYNLVIEYAEETGSAAIIFEVGTGTAPNYSPAAISPKAANQPLGMNGRGLTANYYTSTGSVGSTTKIPVLAYVWTTQPNSQLVRTLVSAKYTGRLRPTTSATYTFLMPSALNFYINGVKKTWTAAPTGGYTTTQALVANTEYNILIEAGLGTYTNFYLKWKYGSLPYSALDLRYLLP